MPLKRQKTAVKRQRRNSRKTRRIRRRGGGENIFTLDKEAKEYEREWLRKGLDRPALIEKYVTIIWPEQMEQAESLIEFFSNLRKDNSLEMEDIVKDQDNRISQAINAIKPHAHLKEKLARDIGTYVGDLKKDLKGIFSDENILKLCNLDKGIREAFVSKGLVEKGWFGYRIVK